SFGPAVAPDDVLPTVAVDVADADTVPRQFTRQLVPNPFRRQTSRRIRRAAQFPPRGTVGATGQEGWGSVTEDIDESSGLGTARHGDEVGLPLGFFGQVGPRMLDPLEAGGAPVDGDQVHPAIAVDVE